MTLKQKLWLIQRIIKLLHLYFGGIIKMSNQKDNLTVPDFLKKSVTENEEKKICTMAVEKTSCTISPMERQSIIDHVKGLTEEQLKIMLDYVPIKLIFDRLGRELERNEVFMNSIKGSMSLIDLD